MAPPSSTNPTLQIILAIFFLTTSPGNAFSSMDLKPIPISLCPPLPGADLHHLSWSYYGLLTTPVTPSQPILHQEPKGIFPKCKVTPLTIKPFYSFLLLSLITKTSHSSRVPPRPGPRPPHQTQPHLYHSPYPLCSSRAGFLAPPVHITCVSSSGPGHVPSSLTGMSTWLFTLLPQVSAQMSLY